MVGLRLAKAVQAGVLYGEAVNTDRFYNRVSKRVDLAGIHNMVQTVQSEKLRDLLSVMLGSIEDRSQLLNSKSVGDHSPASSQSP